MRTANTVAASGQNLAPGGESPNQGTTFAIAASTNPSKTLGMFTEAPFIEQSFVSCADSPEGSAAPVSTQDECYDGPVLTLSLNGSTITTGSISGANLVGGATPSNVTFNGTGAVTVGGAVGTDIGTVTVTNSAGTTFQSTVNART